MKIEQYWIANHNSTKYWNGTHWQSGSTATTWTTEHTARHEFEQAVPHYPPRQRATLVLTQSCLWIDKNGQAHEDTQELDRFEIQY